METQTLAPSSVLENIMNVLRKIFQGKNARRNIIVISLLVLALGYTYYSYFYKSTPTTYEYAIAAKKDIKKTVEGSGKVVSVSELTIQQLQNAGKVTAVYVKPGDFVKQGQIIATLDNRQALIQLQQAKASYDKVVNGATKEDLAITNQSVTNAKQSYDITKQQQDTAVANAKRTLLNTSVSAVAVYDSRIQPNTPTVSGSYTCTDDEEYIIRSVMSSYVSVSSKQFNDQVIISSVPQALGNCGLFLSFDPTKDYSNGEWKITLPNKISSSYSANLASYNNALIARDQAMLNAQTAITNAELNLNQKVAGSRAEDVSSARASYASANLNYENTIIRAPFDGQIGAVSAAVGQQTNSQQGVATIITKDKIAEISLNEIDIVNVRLGQPVELTFDAIPNETFVGSVAQIDTVGVNTSNVVSFATKISIPNADERIKSGMSVTANIITEKKEGVLSVPSGTIKTEGEGENMKSYVMKKLGSPVSVANANFASSTSASSTRKNFRNRNTSTSLNTQNTKVYVTTGVTNDIDTEIIDGLVEGDQVVSKTTDGTVTTKTATTFSLFGGGARPGGTGGNGGARTTGGNTAR